LAVSHCINLAVPRDEHQHRQRHIAHLRKRQLRNTPTAGLYATPQHEPPWSVSLEAPLSHHYLCDCELEIACMHEYRTCIELPRQQLLHLIVQTGSTSLHDSTFGRFPPISTFPYSASFCPPKAHQTPPMNTTLTIPLPTGPGEQLRNTPSNMFQVRQNESRAPLGTNRFQNGKLGKEPRTNEWS
jgi:hypothetical protein